MQGERIEAVDYANAPIVKARVYEMPNKTNDKHNQMYTSLYDAPSGTGSSPQDTTHVEESNANEFYENQYEVPLYFLHLKSNLYDYYLSLQYYVQLSLVFVGLISVQV
jgi:hypothetical protein